MLSHFLQKLITFKILSQYPDPTVILCRSIQHFKAYLTDTIFLILYAVCN